MFLEKMMMLVGSVRDADLLARSATAAVCAAASVRWHQGHRGHECSRSCVPVQGPRRPPHWRSGERASQRLPHCRLLTHYQSGNYFIQSCCWITFFTNFYNKNPVSKVQSKIPVVNPGSVVWQESIFQIYSSSSPLQTDCIVKSHPVFEYEGFTIR